MFSLYIHIPFCKKKCSYCDFISYTKLNDIDSFISALEKEFSLYKTKKINFDTLYLGGGTPSVLNEKQLKKLFNIIKKNTKEISNFKESTIELNPESINEEKLKIIKEYGFSRLSIGMQTSNEKYLKLLERLSSYENFLKVYEKARKLNFNNINLDLIYAIPNQTLKEFKTDLKNILNLRPEHISSYCLEIHKNTPLYKLNLIQDDNLANKMYYELIKTLKKEKYIHYEISNFSLKGKESLHNLNYWNWGNYLGLGISSSSHIDKKRFSNEISLKNYFEKLNNNKKPIAFEETLTNKDILNEKIILGLRKIKGIEENDNIIIKFKEEIKKYIKEGYLKREKGKIKIKEKFLFVSNSLLSKIIKK